MRQNQLTLDANPKVRPNDRDAIIGECQSEGHVPTVVVQLLVNANPQRRPNGAEAPSPGQVIVGTAPWVEWQTGWRPERAKAI